MTPTRPGPCRREATEVDAAGMFHVPAGLVHRDVNPLDGPQQVVMTVVGEGPLVVKRRAA